MCDADLLQAAAGVVMRAAARGAGMGRGGLLDALELPGPDLRREMRELDRRIVDIRDMSERRKVEVEKSAELRCA